MSCESRPALGCGLQQGRGGQVRGLLAAVLWVEWPSRREPPPVCLSGAAIEATDHFGSLAAPPLRRRATSFSSTSVGGASWGKVFSKFTALAS
jgi:hypothetical protein